MNTEELKMQAENILSGGKEKAAAILEDGGKMDQLLEQVEAKLETVPKAGSYLAEVPRMISLLKDHIQKDYTQAPTKTLVLIVAALLYLVNPKDLIPDKIIGVGLKTETRKKKAVLLPDDIVPVLEDIIQQKDGLLFDMSENKFYEIYYQALKDAGISRHLTPYSCRHTTATVLAVHENVAPQTLQRIMRWKSTKMMDRYVTPSDQDARKAVNKI